MSKGGDLKAQLLGAALECSAGDTNKQFTFEELLVAAWHHDPVAWGLRGFERKYPDSERIHRELDSRGKNDKGMVALGYLEKVESRVYRLTPKGIAAASSLSPDNVESREWAGRALEVEIKQIIEHAAFRDWLRNPSLPKRFREAGHFWGVAPGTPPRVIRERIKRVDDTLQAALALLDERMVDEVRDSRGGVLFDRNDIERGLDFQRAMRERFVKEILMLTGAAV